MDTDADDVMPPGRIGTNASISLVHTATWTVGDDVTPLGVCGDRSLDS